MKNNLITKIIKLKTSLVLRSRNLRIRRVEAQDIPIVSDRFNDEFIYCKELELLTKDIKEATDAIVEKYNNRLSFNQQQLEEREISRAERTLLINENELINQFLKDLTL